jgi:hypothetical protein
MTKGNNICFKYIKVPNNSCGVVGGSTHKVISNNKPDVLIVYKAYRK